MLAGCEITSEESNEKIQEDSIKTEMVTSTDKEAMPKNYENMQEVFSESYFYRSHKYVIYADGIAMVVEGREEKDNFYWKESVSYMNLKFPVDAYLCDKNGIKVEPEEDAYLYIDFGNLGKWWCDPFGNLNSNLQVDAEFVPEGLVEKIKARILEGWYDIKELEENTGLMQLTLEELKGRMQEETVNEILAEKGEGQDYFDNGYPVELVTLIFDPMTVNKILDGEMDKNELEVDVTVKKKFVNDFINMSYGPW